MQTAQRPRRKDGKDNLVERDAWSGGVEVGSGRDGVVEDFLHH